MSGRLMLAHLSAWLHARREARLRRQLARITFRLRPVVAMVLREMA